jgi:hypothetical protein
MVWTDTILVCVSRTEGSRGQPRAFTWDISRTGSQPDVRGGDIGSESTWRSPCRLHGCTARNRPGQLEERSAIPYYLDFQTAGKHAELRHLNFSTSHCRLSHRVTAFKITHSVRGVVYQTGPVCRSQPQTVSHQPHGPRPES